MIYTVTLNPSLDYLVEVGAFQLGRTNRTTREEIKAGGKGINVSRLLKNLGWDSMALGFVAGFSGEEILRQLETWEIAHDFVKVSEGNSRINIKLTNMEGTEMNGQGPSISGEEEQELWEKLLQITKGDVLFLSGNIPASLPRDWYQQVMQRLQEKQILVVLDTSGNALTEALRNNPFLIKPNHHELGEMFGVTLKLRQDVIPYGRKLQEMGARNVLISLAGEGAVLLTENGQVLSAPAPKGNLQNAVGAGDAMVGGFVAGWLERQDYEWAFQMAVAAGSASAFSKEFATQQEIQEVLKQVEYTNE